VVILKNYEREVVVIRQGRVSGKGRKKVPVRKKVSA